MAHPNLFDYLVQYFSESATLGMNPVIILDTSAIIGLEQAHQKHYSFPFACTFLDNLANCSPTGVQIIAPPQIKKEVIVHNGFKIAGRPEISDQTTIKIQALEDDQEMKLFQQEEYPKIDENSYFLRQMYLDRMRGKKRDDDPISREDWSVIDTAMAYAVLGRHKFELNDNAGKPRRFAGTPKAAALSGDKHILWTIEEALKQPEMVAVGTYLKALNVRDYTLVPQTSSR